MRHLLTFGLFLGIPLAVFVLWIEASERDDSNDAGLPSRIVSPEVRPVATQKQGDSNENPFGISRLNSVNTSTDRDETTDSIVVAADRQFAFRNFHEQFRAQFSSIVGDFGISRMWIFPDTSSVEHSVRGGSTWTIFQSSLGTRIMPKQSDGEIASFLVAFDEGMVDGLWGFPDVEDLQSLRYLGSKPDPSSGTSTPGLFEQTVNLFNEPISKTEWKLVRLELIGLLKHATPVSYTSKSIPKMGEINFVPTAPLNSFEAGAIERLRSNPEQDAVIHDGKDEIQIVGALRAEQQCQKCHDVKRGELLGGLTYRLIRSREITRHRGEMRNEFLGAARSPGSGVR